MNVTGVLPTTEIGWATCAYLIDVLARVPALATLTITPGYPGENNIEPEHLWFSDIARFVARDTPGFTGGRVYEDHVFEHVLQFGVFDLTTLEDVQARMSEVIGAIDSRLRDNPALDNFDGVLSCLIVGDTRRTVLLPSEVEGYAEITIRVTTRLN